MMVKLNKVDKIKRKVCPACYARGEIVFGCSKCSGKGFITSTSIQYKVAPKPIEIVKVDRDPKTGILRYWENQSEFFYETTTPELNKYVPEVPYGIHLLHDSFDEAFAEAERINKALDKQEVDTIRCSENKSLAERSKELNKMLNDISKAALLDLDDFLNIK
jgi:hypothetical protein